MYCWRDMTTPADLFVTCAKLAEIEDGIPTVIASVCALPTELREMIGGYAAPTQWCDCFFGMMMRMRGQLSIMHWESPTMKWDTQIARGREPYVCTMGIVMWRVGERPWYCEFVIRMTHLWDIICGAPAEQVDEAIMSRWPAPGIDRAAAWRASLREDLAGRFVRHDAAAVARGRVCRGHQT